MFKYADKSYLIIPASDTHTVMEELNHAGNWAESCNLQLNHHIKTREMLSC